MGVCGRIPQLAGVLRRKSSSPEPFRPASDMSRRGPRPYSLTSGPLAVFDRVDYGQRGALFLSFSDVWARVVSLLLNVN
jgi:hypothetical protein